MKGDIQTARGSVGFHQEYFPNTPLSTWIADQFAPGYTGKAIDVGASDGITVSSSYSLEKSMGWKVICVEPNPQFEKSLRKHREMVEMCACDAQPAEVAEFKVHLGCAEAYSSLRPTTDHHAWHPLPDAKWATIKVKVKTLDQMLAERKFNRLDALCVDTEGTELDVLKGLDLAKWLPHVVVVESWDERGPCVDYLESFGYQRANRILVNDCFIRDW